MTTYGTATSLRRPARALGVLFLLVAGGVAAPEARAAADAGGFIADFGRQAIAIMKGSDLSTADRQHQFQALMAQDFDLPRISRLVLGNYWQEASESQRQQFADAFGTYMASVYALRFAEYNPQSFHVTKQLAKSEAMTVVSSEISRMSTGEEIDLDWIVAKTPDSYKVIDITAGGLSLSWVQHEEFESVLHRNGDQLANLIRQLLEIDRTGRRGALRHECAPCPCIEVSNIIIRAEVPVLGHSLPPSGAERVGVRWGMLESMLIFNNFSWHRHPPHPKSFSP